MAKRFVNNQMASAISIMASLSTSQASEQLGGSPMAKRLSKMKIPSAMLNKESALQSPRLKGEPRGNVYTSKMMLVALPVM